MLRFILLSILLTILFRAVSRLWAGVVRGMQNGNPSAGRRADGSSVPQRGVQMVRDPICGTFVVAERAVTLSAGDGQRLYFCSTDCRDKYRSQSESNHEPVHGRTA